MDTARGFSTHEQNLGTKNWSGNGTGGGDPGRRLTQVGHAEGGCGSRDPPVALPDAAMILSRRFCRRDGSGASGLLQVTWDQALTLLFFFLPLCASFCFFPKPFVFLPFSCPSFASPSPRHRSWRSAAGAFVAPPGQGTFAAGCPGVLGHRGSLVLLSPGELRLP